MIDCWQFSFDSVPDNERIVLAVKDRCHFICFYENGNFWCSSQRGIPIKKRLKRTIIKEPLYWIDYPDEKETK